MAIRASNIPAPENGKRSLPAGLRICVEGLTISACNRLSSRLVDHCWVFEITKVHYSRPSNSLDSNEKTDWIFFSQTSFGHDNGSEQPMKSLVAFSIPIKDVTSRHWSRSYERLKKLKLCTRKRIYDVHHHMSGVPDIFHKPISSPPWFLPNAIFK